jgi:hypothetical protein
MNVEFGTKAAQFPEKEYINGIFLQCEFNLLVFPCFIILRLFFLL